MAAKTEAKPSVVETKNNPTKPIIDPNDTFIEAIMRQKHIDHEASHSNLINQFLHLISSSIFLYCYAIFFNDYERAVYLGLTSLIIRQAGHYVFEPPCHDAEQAMLGFDTQNKVKIVITYGAVPALLFLKLVTDGTIEFSLAQLWLVVTMSVVFGRVALLWYRYSFAVSMHWYIKFITDPFTDIPAYWMSSYQIFQPKLLKGALHMSFPSTFEKPEGYVAPKSGYDKKNH
uniref:Uncharacterized protein n=1 Tax=Aplanochytrium stocchinoi TaxID=215587 RepID=A0A7S3LLD2_9STRA|mmetsp:Transcript_17527/g.21578  ORF Transcript_17527/g.21578 Transcript_17527/m.21578 type:complete len:230 (-) Transcript_17527:835-1524(-)|eukprot:CAMPEP_0204824542 /NCGR_PEP_ID=MMETSP1346-20131115/2542_1 /ASSEMBLY_ACC=CAM_ASM_000771 /TAXON_ID=215587 /ORGANISM="Aplanochytrium stocchinoi, Strain GSBS06" /LENGTH=229 /DNA_ID=CAMNT_0051951737 /DNA_START=190 /DNA_END=879 /DNA_ORIENTATION=-